MKIQVNILIDPHEIPMKYIYIYLLNQGEPITKRAPQHHLSRYRSAFRGIRVQPMFATLLPGGGPEKTGEPEEVEVPSSSPKAIEKTSGNP